MEFPSGLRAHIFVSWLHPFKEQKLVVVGDKKMAVFDDTQNWEKKLLLFPHEIHWENNIPVPTKAEPELLDIPQDEPLRCECEHFLHCISNKCEPLTNGREGLRVLKILNAAQQSLDKQLTLTSKENILPTSFKPKIQTKAEDFYAHPTAVIDKGCEIDDNTKIWHFSHIMSGSKIGKNCNIGQNVVIGPETTVGNSCKIQNNVSIYKGVTLEDGVFCGPSMVFTNVFNPRAEIRKMDQMRSTLVKKGATIGANATIICGITLGCYSFIGAGSVVTQNILDYALVVGNPAKQIGWMCKCGERLTHKLECPSCHRLFIEYENGLKEK
ncbi:UDP-2-acetamido-3-amino-2,3-dideoxy-glucuronate N-acetyltransferase [Candidatus Magnetomoraceae bacterium gMMP-15]